MAWEISKGSYCFFGNDSNDSFDDMEPDYPFQHNPIHDLESLWWIAIWTLTWNSPSGSPRNGDQNIWHWNIFHGMIDRFSLLSRHASFVKFVKALPLPFRKVGPQVASLRSSLVHSYETAEIPYKALNNQPFADSELPKTFVERLAKVVQICPDVKLDNSQKSLPSIIPQNKRDASPSTSRSGKRLRPSTQNKSDGSECNDPSTSSLAKCGTGRSQHGQT
jgi:hypothetical protein